MLVDLTSRGVCTTRCRGRGPWPVGEHVRRVAVIERVRQRALAPRCQVCLCVLTFVAAWLYRDMHILRPCACPAARGAWRCHRDLATAILSLRNRSHCPTPMTRWGGLARVWLAATKSHAVTKEQVSTISHYSHRHSSPPNLFKEGGWPSAAAGVRAVPSPATISSRIHGPSGCPKRPSSRHRQARR